MAESLYTLENILPDWRKYSANLNDQNDEILALKSFYENTEDIQLLEEPSLNSSNKYKIQVKIPIKTPCKSLKVQLWQQNLFVEEIKCEYLPNILLELTLPDTYPSESSPFFQLSSIWLNETQLTSLSIKLDEIWNENLNMPVLFTWFEWIKENLIEYLDLFKQPDILILSPVKSETKRVKCLFENSEHFLYEFLRNNYLEELKEFKSSVQTCLICFEEKLGKYFYRLDCKHTFCADCLKSMCQMHVKDGTINLLKCPDEKCKEAVSMNIMSKVLEADEYARWERLVFERALDVMEDVMYCPKCNYPIIIDQNDSHAFCDSCKIDFCKYCKELWHTEKCKTEEEKLSKKLNILKISADDLSDMPDEEIQIRFKDKDPIYIIELKQKIKKAAFRSTIDKFLKYHLKCPRCRAPVEKIEGCNKMTCICGCLFCFVCGDKIDGYSHYQNNKRCKIFSHDGEERDVFLRGNRMVCPNCKNEQVKVDKKNLITCWACKINMCFHCRLRIIGKVSLHFKKSDCPEFS